jgi:hypothetical protein
MDVHRNGQVDPTANRHFPDAARNCASGSLATLELPKPMLSTKQTPVYLTETFSPAKWSMLRFFF